MACFYSAPLAWNPTAVDSSRSELGQHRLNFWTHVCDRHPVFGRPDAASSHWAPLPNTEAVVVQYIARSAAGIFVRPPRGGSMEDLGQELAPYLEILSEKLGAPVGGQDSYLSQALKIDSLDHANWDRMADWLNEKTRAYQGAFAQLQEINS